MAGPSTQINPKNSRKGEDRMMGFVVPKKPNIDLLENCDLPPPLKVFAAPTSEKPLTTTSRWRSHGGGIGGGDDEWEKLELMKAVRRSQTRAREAERNGDEMAKEREYLRKALVKESMQLLAYRQWVRLLELQVSKMQYCHRQYWRENKDDAYGEDDDAGGGGKTWVVAMALCLGIAGLGFAFGYTYLF